MGRWPAILAALALVMQVLVPQGFMVSAAGPPGLVICTGHGPLVLTGEHGPAKAPKPQSAPVCTFVGHGVANTPPVPLVLSTVSFAFVVATDAARFDLAPGRGLAAPPPRSHAPPTVLI